MTRIKLLPILLLPAVEAVEEATDNVPLNGVAIEGRDVSVGEAVPIDRLREILSRETRRVATTRARPPALVSPNHAAPLATSPAHGRTRR
jgi:hypothetical protein